MPPFPELLTSVFTGGPTFNPYQISARLLLALAFGGIVAFIYRRSRPGAMTAHSFSATLVLLTILIALVTQVIGDSVARAFSLVGALSIVRFRTVVRDTQDTAYVIFAVVVGMAVGASDPWVAVIGIVVVSIAAFLLRKSMGVAAEPMPYRLAVRLDASRDPDTVLKTTLDQFVPIRQMMSMSTARQGAAFDVSYRTALPSGDSAAALVRGLSALEGVRGVELERSEDE
ncbi:MAG: DUF4956 domain-containing protein [Vicinamibacterales bacterium]